jgi:hypothetical protein
LGRPAGSRFAGLAGRIVGRIEGRFDARTATEGRRRADGITEGRSAWGIQEVRRVSSGR